MATRTNAIYEDGILKPLEKLDLKEGEEVEIELKKSITERTFGIIPLEHDELEEIIEDTEYGSWCVICTSKFLVKKYSSETLFNFISESEIDECYKAIKDYALLTNDAFLVVYKV